MDVKEKLIRVFEKIQYDSEALIAEINTATLSEHDYNKPLFNLKSEVMNRVTKRVKQIEQELLRYHDIDDINLYLDAIALENKEFTSKIQDKINEAIEGKDISEYIYQLKEENGDLFYRLGKKTDPFLKDISEHEVVQSISTKSKEFVESNKSKVEQIKDKITHVVNGVKEKVGK